MWYNCGDVLKRQGGTYNTLNETPLKTTPTNRDNSDVDATKKEFKTYAAGTETRWHAITGAAPQFGKYSDFLSYWELHDKIDMLQLQILSRGMHDIISTSVVSAGTGFKIKYPISASMPISINIITDKITGCCFVHWTPESTSCFTCSLCTDVMFTYFVTGQISPGCGFCFDCLRESIIQFLVGCIFVVLFRSNCHK